MRVINHSFITGGMKYAIHSRIIHVYCLSVQKYLPPHLTIYKVLGLIAIFLLILGRLAECKSDGEVNHYNCRGNCYSLSRGMMIDRLDGAILNYMALSKYPAISNLSH